MKIKEIYLDTYGLENPDHRYEDLKVWIANYGDYIRDFPNFKQYNIKLYQNNVNDNYNLIAFDKENPIAVIVFATYGPYKSILLSRVKQAYQGQNIGIAMYLMLIDFYGAMVSDHTLTQLGKNVWERLLRMPRIKIKTIDPDTHEIGPRLRSLKSLAQTIGSPLRLIAMK